MAITYTIKFLFLFFFLMNLRSLYIFKALYNYNNNNDKRIKDFNANQKKSHFIAMSNPSDVNEEENNVSNNIDEDYGMLVELFVS